jgi:hypothetical protein
MTSLNQRIVSLENGGSDISQAQLDTKQDVLIAGDNITITDNIISSIGSSSTVEPVSGKIFCAIRTSPMFIPTVTEWDSECTTVHITNNNIYTLTNNNRITVKLSGMYKVEFSNTFLNNIFLDRANIRTTVTINGVNDRTIGGQSICYPRHKDFARVATTSGAFVFNLNIDDYIQLYNTIAKASNNNFTSDFSGFEFLLGSNILITYLE